MILGHAFDATLRRWLEAPQASITTMATSSGEISHEDHDLLRCEMYSSSRSKY